MRKRTKEFNSFDSFYLANTPEKEQYIITRLHNILKQNIRLKIFGAKNIEADFINFPKLSFIEPILKLAISLCFCLNLINANAQQTKKMSLQLAEKLKVADENFMLLNYKEALNIYMEIGQKMPGDTAILFRIANTYRNLNDTKNTESWFRRALINNDETVWPLYKLYFAQALTSNGKYEEAKYWYQEYSKSFTADNLAPESIKALNNISGLYSDTIYYLTIPVNFNTIYSEISPAFYKKGLVFLSDRPNSFYQEAKYATEGSLFTLLFSAIDSVGNFSKPVKFIKNSGNKYNDGPAIFFDNYRKMIFTRNCEPSKLSKKEINTITLQLYFSIQDENGGWTDPQPLPFCNKNFSYSQPSISENEKDLYFASNLPGGYGGTDLYVSHFENGIWQVPTNLGNQINTSGDELFPFIFNDSILYFASNGHGGIGGLDIFKTSLKSNKKNITNLGAPLNSNKDDFGIIINPDGISGFFSSNRPASAGNDDIYSFRLVKQTITIKVIDQNLKIPLWQSIVKDELTNKELGITNQEGILSFVKPLQKKFSITISKENFKKESFTFEAKKYSSDYLQVISLTPDSNKVEEPLIAISNEKNEIIKDISKVVYKVQIRAARFPIFPKELNKTYHGSQEVSNFYEDGWYKYSIGNYKSYMEAKNTLLKCGVFDAFIIAYIDDKKVNIVVAKKNTNETYIEPPQRAR